MPDRFSDITVLPRCIGQINMWYNGCGSELDVFYCSNCCRHAMLCTMMVMVEEGFAEEGRFH